MRPFKQNYFGSTFAQYHLFFNISQNKIRDYSWIFQFGTLGSHRVNTYLESVAQCIAYIFAKWPRSVLLVLICILPTGSILCVTWKMNLVPWTLQQCSKQTNLRGEVTVQWWEQLAPTNVTWVWFLEASLYVHWDCCWFPSLLWGFFLEYSSFPPSTKPTFANTILTYSFLF